MKRVAILTALLLAGCATQDHAAPSELTNVELCEAFFYAPEAYAAAAGQEATSRGVRCAEYRDAVATMRQGRDAARQQAASQMLLSRPGYQAPPAPIICRSSPAGGGVQTICR